MTIRTTFACVGEPEIASQSLVTYLGLCLLVFSTIGGAMGPQTALPVKPQL